MDLRKEILDAIESTHGITEGIKNSLYVKIMKIIEASKGALGRKQGITVMTPEASLASDRIAQNRKNKMSKNDVRPKSLWWIGLKKSLIKK